MTWKTTFYYVQNSITCVYLYYTQVCILNAPNIRYYVEYNHSLRYLVALAGSMVSNGWREPAPH